jgi:leader peptidase (prepilin peptidase) / N-methyltransferase
MTILWMILFFVAGAMVGSFINVLADRLPAGKSIISPRSHCFGCQRTIAVRDNVPIVSYLWLRGHCRHCGAHIPQRLLWVEIGTAILFAFLYWYYRFNWELPLALLFCSVFISLLLIDLERSILPNIIVYPSMIIALALAGLGSVLGFEPQYIINIGFYPWIINAVVGGIAGFLLLLLPALLYLFIGRTEGMGWGDVILAALIGLVTGFPLVILAIFLAVITGGIVAGILLLLKIKGRKDPIPFGPFLAVAAMVTLFWGSNLVNWFVLS